MQDRAQRSTEMSLEFRPVEVGPIVVQGRLPGTASITHTQCATRCPQLHLSAHSCKLLVAAALNHHIAMYKNLRSLLSPRNESQIILESFLPHFYYFFLLIHQP